MTKLGTLTKLGALLYPKSFDKTLDIASLKCIDVCNHLLLTLNKISSEQPGKWSRKDLYNSVSALLKLKPIFTTAFNLNQYLY